MYGAFIKVKELAAPPDDRDEALEYHKYAIRIYRNKYDRRLKERRDYKFLKKVGRLL